MPVWAVCCTLQVREKEVIVTEISKGEISIAGASLPFWNYRVGEDTLIEFDSCGCACPIPMQNAMAGLERIATRHEKLIMINGFEPQGLYERIRDHFTWQVEHLSAERVMVVFTPIAGSADRLDFSQRHCKG